MTTAQILAVAVLVTMIAVFVLAIRDRQLWALPLAEFRQKLLLQLGHAAVLLFLFNIGVSIWAANRGSANKYGNSLGSWPLSHGVSESVDLELVDRCQQMGARFAEQIRHTDKQIGIPQANRDFTSRSHYNKQENRCLVLTEGAMTLPIQGGHVLLRQVWDVNLGVGSQAIAEFAVPLDGKDKPIIYRGKEKLDMSANAEQWFDELMTR